MAELADSQYQLLGRQLADAPLLAIDLEMTGLNPQREQILSIGTVPIESGKLRLADAAAVMLSIDGSVGQSAIIHGITDSELATALPLGSAMEWLQSQLKGKIAVAHHAPLDFGFIRTNLVRHFGASPPLLAIDTMTLERRRLLRVQDVINEGSLRLGACRSRYGLPVYQAHNALIDALACGELFLAQTAAMGGDGLSLLELVTLYD